MICNDCGNELELTQDLKVCPHCGRRVDYDFAQFVEQKNGYAINGRTLTLFHVSGLTPEIRARIENNDLDELILTYNIVWNPEFQFSNSPFFRSKQKKVTFKLTIAPQVTKLNFLFAACTELEEAPFFDTSDIQETMYMFYGCRSLTKVPNYNVLRVKKMTGMFQACSSLREISSLTSMQAVEMSYLFADCIALESVNKFYTHSAENIAHMFLNCSLLKNIPDLITTRVKDMSETFKGCCSLKQINKLDCKSVVNMTDCFADCSSLTSLPNLNTKVAESLTGLFKGCSSLVKAPTIETDAIAFLNNISDIFSGCPQDNIVIVTSANEVTPELRQKVATGALDEIIMACNPSEATSPFNRQNVSEFKCQIALLAFVDSTAYMFSDCENLTIAPKLNTAHISDMTGMFLNCKSLTVPPILDLSSAKNLSQMFKNCIQLQEKMTIPDELKKTLHESKDTYEGIPQFTVIGKSLGIIKNLLHRKSA